MRRAVRAIIINDDRLLVMHRNKFGDEYDTLPGGNVEPGESLEEALKREVEEETQVTFDSPRLVFIEHAGDPWGDQYIYYCEYRSGEPRLHPDSEEAHINMLGKNLYQPKWLPLNELKDKPFRSELLKRHILDARSSGEWPSEAVEFPG
jgi:ADP-ribose pyrophosphatase YjhB (NUDIX family)